MFGFLLLGAIAVALALPMVLFRGPPIPAGVWLRPHDVRRISARWAVAIAMIGVGTLIVLAPLAAMAQTAGAPATQTSIAVDIGAIVSGLLAWSRDIVLAAVGVLVTTFVPAAFRQWITNQALEKAIDFGIAAIDGATRDKVLTIPVTSKVLAAAASYVEAQWPSVAGRLGDALKAALLARLSKLGVVPVDATATQLGAAVGTKAA